MALKTVLLVDDERSNRDVYATVLKHGGYVVIEAGDGEEGLRLSSQEQPDLICLDLSLPKLDGWAVIQRLKGDAETQHIPVIALTAHSLTKDHVASAGFDGYLAKPIEPAVVVDEIRRRIGSP